MDISDNSRQLTAGPKARVCYVCGRQYMLHSFDIHIKQCKELFLAREALKDPRERKKLPEDPMEKLGFNGGQSSPEKRSSSNAAGAASPNPVNTESLSLDEINRMATEAFNNEALSRCAFCGRTFLPEKLAIHNRSCTAENPARKVTDGVRKGLPTAEISSSDQPKRPATSSGLPSRPRKVPNEAVQESEGISPMKDGAAKSGETHLKLENGELRGHIGGMAGRNIRATKAPTEVKDVDISAIPEFSSKEEGINLISQRLDALEGMAGTIFNSISELKSALNRLKNVP